MKTCPNCNEVNGDGRSECWKCHTPLKESDRYYKICPKCNEVYTMKATRCKVCDGDLRVCDSHMSTYDDNTSGGEKWQYVIAVLFPLIGIILGCIYLGRQDDNKGKNLLILSIILMIVYGILSSIFFFMALS